MARNFCLDCGAALSSQPFCLQCGKDSRPAGAPPWRPDPPVSDATLVGPPPTAPGNVDHTLVGAPPTAPPPAGPHQPPAAPPTNEPTDATLVRGPGSLATPGVPLPPAHTGGGSGGNNVDGNGYTTPRTLHQPPVRPVPPPVRPVAPKYAPAPATKGQGKMIAAVVSGVLVLALLAAGGYFLLSRDDDPTSPAADGKDPVTKTEESPKGDESTPSADPEPDPEPATPVEVEWSEAAGDTQKGNSGAFETSTADIHRVRAVQPSGSDPGWVMVDLQGGQAGVGVIVRIDTDWDGLPNYTVWQHSSGAEGSFKGSYWSHGEDILARLPGTGPTFNHPGAQQPGAGGYAFPMKFRDSEMAGGEIRINIQTLNDDRYYDYFPRRQKWSKAIPFKAVW